MCPWSPSCQWSQGQCGSINTVGVWSIFPSHLWHSCPPPLTLSAFLYLPLNLWLSPKAPLSGLWKPAAVGVPIRAPQRGKSELYRGSHRNFRHQYEMNLGATLCSLSISSARASLRRKVRLWKTLIRGTQVMTTVLKNNKYLTRFDVNCS